MPPIVRADSTPSHRDVALVVSGRRASVYGPRIGGPAVALHGLTVEHALKLSQTLAERCRSDVVVLGLPDASAELAPTD